MPPRRAVVTGYDPHRIFGLDHDFAFEPKARKAITELFGKKKGEALVAKLERNALYFVPRGGNKGPSNPQRIEGRRIVIRNALALSYSIERDGPIASDRRAIDVMFRRASNGQSLRDLTRLLNHLVASCRRPATVHVSSTDHADQFYALALMLARIYSDKEAGVGKRPTVSARDGRASAYMQLFRICVEAFSGRTFTYEQLRKDALVAARVVAGRTKKRYVRG